MLINIVFFGFKNKKVKIIFFITALTLILLCEYFKL